MTLDGSCAPPHDPAMTDPFAPYIAQQPDEFRAALDDLAKRIEARLPADVERVISYAMPGWRVKAPKGTKMAAGMAGFAKHIGLYPHCGTVVPKIADRLRAEGIAHSKSGITFRPDTPPPDWVLDEIIRRRLDEIG
ncbi:hypothetical protein BD830_103371 [Maritimibacter alkaliphilus HTCC2654]|uniref:YdhG-like domain-containing protein n=2 Tax=Maritimibacter TaxID=404235 RepID=A3VD86_9RHOB|nr:hypothetical protein RB2654_02249 [Maritimibacter alkaliphilus HTCC2654]TYP83337.1 hypothetical protein BD830_103371 [Maritimibacter alkaliphilus HTCC2654]